MIDLRAEQIPRAGKHRIVRRQVVLRDPSKITGVTVHQTACVFGPRDDIDARNRRALNVACHALTFRDGTTALPNPMRWWVNQGNGFNGRDLGLELEGHYPGREDDPATTAVREDLRSTWGGEPTPLTPAILDGFRAGLRALVTIARDEGLPIEYVHAHRQSSGDRRSDPGEAIWRGVVLYMRRELDLTTEPDLWLPSSNAKNENGRPIPREWGEGSTRY